MVFVDHYREIPHQQMYAGHPRYLGMSDPQKFPNVCTIWMKKPDNWDDKEKMEIVGHELMHCVWGLHED